MQGIEKHLTRFPIPLHIRAPNDTVRGSHSQRQHNYLVFITYKLPIRRATFSSKRGEIHKTILLSM